MKEKSGKMSTGFISFFMLVLSASCLCLSAPAHAEWTGFGLKGDEITHVVIDPNTKPSTLYALTSPGKVYKSATRGADWQLSGPPSKITVTCLAIDSSVKPSIIYAGTASDGLYSSTDEGQRWAPNNWFPSGTDVVSVQVQIVSTSSSSSSMQVNSEGAPYILSNTLDKDGKNPLLTVTWNRGVSSYKIPFPSEMDKNMPFDVCFTVCGGIYLEPLAGALTREESWYTDDWGQTWTPKEEVPAELRCMAWTERQSSEQGKTGPYAGIGGATTSETWYAGTGNGVYVSTNYGQTWTAVNSGLPKSANVYALAVSPANSQTIYAGTRGRGVFMSTNGGKKWSADNPGLTNLDVNCLAFDPANPQTLYAGTSGGVYVYGANQGSP